MKDVVLVVGNADTILGFKSIGLSTLTYEEGSKDILKLQEYIQNGTKIIFITEDIKIEIQHIIEKYEQNVYPMFVIIPALGQGHTQGKKYIQSLVVQALGSASLDN